MRLLLALPLLPLLFGPARADEKEIPKPAPLTTEQAADAVLKAVEAEDAMALEALAKKDDPDPWLVADELCYRDEHDAAMAFARAAPRKAVEKLPEYVGSRRGKEPRHEIRTALASMNAALDGKQWQSALDSAEGVESSLDFVAAVRVTYGRGKALLGLKRHAASASVFREAARAALGLGWFARAAQAYHWAGLSAYHSSDWHAALSAWMERLRLAQLIQDSHGTARALNCIGGVQLSFGRYGEALENYERSLQMAKDLEDREGFAKALGNIGIVRMRLGRHREALACFERSLKVEQELGNRRDVATLLGRIGVAQANLGKHAEALRSQERALEMAKALGDARGIAVASGNIGDLHAVLGRHGDALDSYQRSLKLARELGDLQTIAIMLASIGGIQRYVGRFREALRSSKQSLQILEDLGDRRSAVRALMGIGRAHASLGQYAAALRSLERALGIAKDLGDRPFIQLALGMTSSIQARLGSYDEALQNFRLSLKMAEDLGDPRTLAKTLGSIGVVHSKLRRYGEALRAYERALKLHERLGDHSGVANALNHIGSLCNSLGRYREALQHFERSLTMAEELGDRDLAATVLGNIGVVQGNLGRYEAASQAYDRAGTLLLEFPSLIGRAHNAQGLATLHFRQGRFDQAVESARRAVQLVADLSSGLAEGEGARARDQFSRLFETGIQAASRRGTPVDLLWFLEQGRAGSLREGLGARTALEDSLIPDELRRDLGLARGAARHALDKYRKAPRDDLEARRAALRAWEAARVKVRKLAERLQREAKHAAFIALGEPKSLEAIRSSVGPREALVLFGLTIEESVALVVRRSGARIVMLPGSARIESAAEAVLEGDRHIAADAVPALKELIVKPLDLDKDIKRVLVSPMGRLGYVPFSLLFPDREVAYVPSATTYDLLLEDKSMRGTDILALGDPDYQTRMDEVAHRIRAGNVTKLRRLPATKKEVEEIADVSLLDKRATETGLHDAIKTRRRWRAVHFACHGLVDPEHPMLSALALTADAKNDGFLTALEIFGMKVPADLVVMSACETGKGKIYKTEGIVGLTRAFMFAGAPRVICSLWRVDDKATQALMIKFYELWNPRDGSKGLGCAAALKRAQEYVRAQPGWEHPYYWAAWVLWGLAD